MKKIILALLLFPFLVNAQFTGVNSIYFTKNTNTNLLIGNFISPIISGGTGTTSTLTFKTTHGVATTGSDFIWVGGTDGGTELMRLKANNQLVLRSNGVNLNGAGTQNYIAAGTNTYTDYFAGTVHKFYSYAVGAYFVQFANGTSTANYISTPITLGSNSIAAASSVVEMVSTTKGFLPPRMTATQASAISSPAEGLLVYVTDTNGTFTAKGWWGYDGAAWQKLNN